MLHSDNGDVKMKKLFTTHSMAKIAMVAGLYTVLCLVFAPFSYGPIQFRIAEALVLLAIFSPEMVVAITLGCGLANLLGFMMGVNPLLIDVFFGTFATGIAGVLSWKLRNFRYKSYPLLAAIPPVIINAIIIGAEITFLETGHFFANASVFFTNFGYIALSQFIPCFILAPALVILLEKTGLAQRHLVVA